jgi:hypothetical protein
MEFVGLADAPACSEDAGAPRLELDLGGGMVLRKRSMNECRLDLAAGAWVAYTGVYVADDFLRVRSGRPQLRWRPIRWLVASENEAGH